MPEIIVTQTMQDYIKYQKKKARQEAINLFLGVIVFVVGMGSICGLMGYFNG